MLKRFLFLAVCLLAFSSEALATRERVQGWCQDGGLTISVAGVTSSTATTVQRSFASCTVTVYAAGTTTLSTIYSDAAGTSQANPFTATSAGRWFFYVDGGRYDVRFSGGGISSAFTLGDFRVPNESFSVTDYGALCDGTTNDYTAINRARVAATALTNGGTVLFPGTSTSCRLSTSITFDEDVTVRMEGGSRITADSGVTVTFTGLEAPPSRIFTGSGTFAFSGSRTPEYLPQWWGALADQRRVTDGAITNAATTLTSATAAFTSADVGRRFIIAGAANTGGTLALTGSITTFTNSTTVTVSVSASTSVTAAVVIVGSDDTTPVQSAFDAVGANGGTVFIPPGLYLVSSELLIRPAGSTTGEPIVIRGGGRGTTAIYQTNPVKNALTLDFSSWQTGSKPAYAGMWAVRGLSLIGGMTSNSAASCEDAAYTAADSDCSKGLNLRNAEFGRVEDVAIYEAGGIGLHCQGCFGSQFDHVKTGRESETLPYGLPTSSAGLPRVGVQLDNAIGPTLTYTSAANTWNSLVVSASRQRGLYCSTRCDTSVFNGGQFTTNGGESPYFYNIDIATSTTGNRTITFNGIIVEAGGNAANEPGNATTGNGTGSDLGIRVQNFLIKIDSAYVSGLITGVSARQLILINTSAARINVDSGSNLYVSIGSSIGTGYAGTGSEYTVSATNKVVIAEWDGRTGALRNTDDLRLNGFETMTALNAAASTAGTRWYFTKARGTPASPTIVLVNDDLGQLRFRGYDGASYQDAAAIRVNANAAPGAGDMPGSITFATVPDGSTTLTDALTIDETQALVMQSNNLLRLAGRTFANLGTPTNGSLIYCSDCTIANPCGSGGTGAMAKRINGTWICN